MSGPAQLFINKGSRIARDGRDYIVLHLVDLSTMLCRDEETGQRVMISMSSLAESRPIGDPIQRAAQPVDLLTITADQWRVAEAHRAAIEPLLADLPHGERNFAITAAKYGVSVPTLYRWAQLYRESGGLLTSLLPTVPNGNCGKGRLQEAVEAIITDYVKTKYLTNQKRTKKVAISDIRLLCANAKLSKPAPNTIRLRMDWLSKREVVKRREGDAAAEDRFDKNHGSIPNANWPLQMVEMDHTLLPVIIVDDIYRKPIRRAWITLAIDVFSRVCLGFYMSMDAPSAMSAGLCMVHCILQKETWMARICPEEQWPFYGKMDHIHMDNAGEFRGNMMDVACNQRYIDLIWRPVAKPRYGAHIERLMGTVSQALKSLGGATFSGPTEKGEYDSDVNAFMTFDELEQWLVLMFCKYHFVDGHSGIGGITPAQKFSEGLLGSKTQPVRGLPPVEKDPERLKIDFLPFDERVVHPHGIVIDNIVYWDDVLIRWIGQKDPTSPKKNLKHKIRRDDRDISIVYFWDENTKRFYRIISCYPPISIWDYKKAREMAADDGVEKPTEREVQRYLIKLKSVEDAASEKTRGARSAQQKRAQHSKALGAKGKATPPAPPAPSSPAPVSAPATLSTSSTPPSFSDTGPSLLPPANPADLDSDHPDSQRSGSKIQGYDPVKIKIIPEEDD